MYLVILLLIYCVKNLLHIKKTLNKLIIKALFMKQGYILYEIEEIS